MCPIVNKTGFDILTIETNALLGKRQYGIKTRPRDRRLQTVLNILAD